MSTTQILGVVILHENLWSTIYQTFDGKDLYPSIEEKDTITIIIVNLINKKNNAR